MRRVDKEYNYLTKLVDIRKISSTSFHFACPKCGGKIGRSGYAVALSGGLRVYCNQPSCDWNKSYSRKGISMVDFVQQIDPTVRGYHEALEKINKQRVVVELDLFGDAKGPTKQLSLPQGTQLILHGGGVMADAARRYLSGRGYNLQELHDHYRIGYNPTTRESDPEYGWLVIPFYDAYYRLVYYQKRSFLPRTDEKRWDNPNAEVYGIGKSSLLFNEYALYSGAQEVIATEGATDSMTLGPTATGTLGLSLSQEAAFKLKHRGSRDLIYFLDSGAWIDCLLNAYQLVEAGDEDVWVVPMEPGEDDPNTLGRDRSFQIIKERKFKLDHLNIFSELERVHRVSGKTYRSSTSTISWV